MARRRVTKKELKRPDEVQTRLSRLLAFLLRNKRWIALGLVAVIAAGAGFYLWEKGKVQREEAASWRLAQALKAERPSERTSALAGLIEAYPETPSAMLARLFRARDLMEEGRWKEAEEDLSFLLRKAPPPLKAQAYCLMADVLKTEGKEEKAVQALRKCQQEAKGWLEAYALFKEALLQDSRGQRKEALEAYRKVLPLLPPGELELFVRLRLKELEGS